METLNSISTQLATDSLTPEQIKCCLRALGYREIVRRPRTTLSASAALAPHFNDLATIFPQARKILSDFQLSKVILDKLVSSTGLETDPHNLADDFLKQRTANPFCSLITGKTYKPIEFSQHPRISESVAFLWFVNTAIHAFSGITLTPNLVEFLNASFYIVENFHIAIKREPSLGKASETSFHHYDIEAWIKLSSVLIHAAGQLINYPKNPSLENIQSALSEACSLIRNIEAIPQSSMPPQPDHPQEPNADISSHPAQRGIGLSERERLASHATAFLEFELTRLSHSIRDILEKEYDGTFRQQKLKITKRTDATPPFFIEAAIVALAMLTGRSIEHAIKFPLTPASNESIEFKHLQMPYGDAYIYPFWVRKLDYDEPLRIPLPKLLRLPFVNIFQYSGTTTLEDCLPYSIKTWEDRCYDWLNQQLSGTQDQIRRKIRDTLVREIYKSSASSSLLTLIGTPPTRGGHKGESLSNYVNPFSERTIGAYAAACKRLGFKYDDDVIKYFGSATSFGVSEAEHKNISEYFISNIQACEKSNNHIEHHNWFARYCLMLLIVATGHRISKTPFFFHWDILTDENLAFICDKTVVGSEARFVPLPRWVSEQIREYHKHLLSFSDHLAYEWPELARKIRYIASGGDIRSLEECLNNDGTEISIKPFGMFFTVDSKGRGIPLTTFKLGESYRSVSTVKISPFRKSAADALWSSGLSGQQVDAFLGHNGEMHLFGESSSWSFIGWADQIRPKLEEYLSSRGWIPVKAWVKKSSQRNIQSDHSVIPLIKSSKDGYEGRERMADQARARAKALIRSNLPEDWFSDSNSSITDKDFKTLKEIVVDELNHDPSAAAKVNEMLALEIDSLRARLRTVSSTVANLTRTEPSPIEISSSRYIAMAKVIRRWWIGKLGQYKRESQEIIPDRLVEIGISLVIFDAVLDIHNWRSLLLSIANHETRSAHDCLIAHTLVKKSTMVFDKSLILSPHTAALVIGYEKHFSTFKPENSIAKTVTRLIPKKFRDAPRALNSDVLTLNDLILIYRPWWQIRLPGAQFAIACGKYSGPAADAQSECAIYDISFLYPYQKPDSTSRTYTNVCTSTHKAALQAFKDMFDKAEGEFDKMEATSRSQRKELKRLLVDKVVTDLQVIADQQPVVDLLLGFILYLTVEGGPRKEVLKFSVICQYFSRIRLLTEILWDTDPQDFEAEDFDKYYRQLLERMKGTTTNTRHPLSLFHKYLRETINAPSCRIAPNSERIPTQCRTALITIEQFNEAWKFVDKQTKGNVQLNQHAKSYLGIGYDYGLRRKEIFGLEADHLFVSKNESVEGIQVKPNRVRDLKSSSSNRLVPSLLSEKQQSKHLVKIVALTTASPAKEKFIFADTEQRNQLYSTRTIDAVVRDTLKKNTANYDVVPHSMRHMAGTRLAHFAFETPRHIHMSLSKYAEQSIKGSLESEKLFSSFDGGFHAWPFWIDRVAMLLGHSDASTLLNTYWHTSSLRLAEHTWHKAHDVQFTGDQVALMLGLDRTTIAHKRVALLKKSGSSAEHPNSYIPLISNYITKSKFPELGGSNNRANKHRKHNKAENNSTGVGEDIPVVWVLYDRLIRCRQRDRLSPAELEEQARMLGLKKKIANTFIKEYQEIVEHTGFDDFEPSDPQFLASNPKRSAGILPGARARERGLTAAHRLAQSSVQFADTLCTVMSLWIERINPLDPWFVAENENEVLSVINVLTAIGVENSQLEFCQYNFDTACLNNTLTHLQLISIKTRTARISFGRSRKPSEVGIRVMQKQKSKIGDNRDTHRLFLILASIIRSENKQTKI